MIVAAGRAGAGGSLGSLGQNLLGDLASSVLPGVISGLAGTLGDIGGAMDPSTLLGSGLDSSTLGNGLDTTALGTGLSNGLDLTPTGSVIDNSPINSGNVNTSDQNIQLTGEPTQKDLCIQECLFHLDGPKNGWSTDIRDNNFHKCVNDCMARAES